MDYTFNVIVLIFILLLLVQITSSQLIVFDQPHVDLLLVIIDPFL
jgi:hypothetical protein